MKTASLHCCANANSNPGCLETVHIFRKELTENNPA